MSLQAPIFAPPAADAALDFPAGSASSPVPQQHPAWTDDTTWKHRLDNLLLLLQPFICACLLLPWLRLLPLPRLTVSLADLCAHMNTYRPLYPT